MGIVPGVCFFDNFAFFQIGGFHHVHGQCSNHAIPDSRWRSCIPPIRGGGVAHHCSSVAAMWKNILAAFRPVKFEYGKIHMSGGYNTKPLAMKSKTVDNADGQSKTFVKMSSTEAWLVCSTTGACHKNGSSFDRTSLLGDLRDRISRLCDGVDGVDAPPVQAPGESDPMI